MKNEYLGLSDTPLLEWLAEFFTRSLQRLTDLSAEPTSICFGWERFPFCPITKRAKTGRCFLPAGFSNPHSKYIELDRNRLQHRRLNRAFQTHFWNGGRCCKLDSEPILPDDLVMMTLLVIEKGDWFHWIFPFVFKWCVSGYIKALSVRQGGYASKRLEKECCNTPIQQLEPNF